MMLGSVIADYRLANRLGVRGLAKQIGISHPTLNRFEHGENCDAETLIKIMAWLFTSGDHRRQCSTEIKRLLQIAKEAERVCRIDWSGNNHDAFMAIQYLRAAVVGGRLKGKSKCRLKQS